MSYVCVCSIVSDSATLWTIAYQFPLSMEFSRQEYYSRLPFSTPGDPQNPASWSFPISQLFTSDGQSTEASASVLPMNIQG